MVQIIIAAACFLLAWRLEANGFKRTAGFLLAVGAAYIMYLLFVRGGDISAH